MSESPGNGSSKRHEESDDHESDQNEKAGADRGSDARNLDSFCRLMETLAERAAQRPPGSYTTKLLNGGPAKIGSKILEEAAELIEAADESGDDGREHFIYEAGDLIYHTFVMLAWRGVDIQEVAAELARREGTSGLVEKANRPPDSGLNPDLSSH